MPEAAVPSAAVPAENIGQPVTENRNTRNARFALEFQNAPAGSDERNRLTVILLEENKGLIGTFVRHIAFGSNPNDPIIYHADKSKQKLHGVFRAAHGHYQRIQGSLFPDDLEFMAKGYFIEAVEKFDPNKGSGIFSIQIIWTLARVLQYRLSREAKRLHGEIARDRARTRNPLSQAIAPLRRQGLDDHSIADHLASHYDASPAKIAAALSRSRSLVVIPLDHAGERTDPRPDPEQQLLEEEAIAEEITLEVIQRESENNPEKDWALTARETVALKLAVGQSPDRTTWEAMEDELKTTKPKSQGLNPLPAGRVFEDIGRLLNLPKIPKYDEIGAILGINKKNVFKLVSRAKGKIKAFADWRAAQRETRSMIPQLADPVTGPQRKSAERTAVK